VKVGGKVTSNNCGYTFFMCEAEVCYRDTFFKNQFQEWECVLTKEEFLFPTKTNTEMCSSVLLSEIMDYILLH